MIDRNQKGLTLLELIVALGVFSMAVIAAVSIFVTTLNTQRRILATQTGIDNFRYVLAVMTKEIRMAKEDVGFCGHTGQVYHVSEDGDELSFVNYKDECVTYGLSTDGGIIKSVAGSDFTSGDIPVTAEDIMVNKLMFINSEEDFSEVLPQPRVTIAAEFSPKTQGREKSVPINVQTTVSSRYYE